MKKKKIAKKLLKMAKNLIAEDWIMKYGNFSEKTDLYFHSFANLEYLIKALEKGRFGRGMTSIGTEKSYVPYFYQIWFKPKNLKLFPVFYYHNSEKYSEIVMELWNRFKFTAHEVPQVTGDQYKKEQEWYCWHPVELKDIDVKMITYYRQNKPEEIEHLKQTCEKFGYSYTTIPWER